MGNSALTSKAGLVQRRTAEKESVRKMALRSVVGAIIGIAVAVIFMIPASLLISGELLSLESIDWAAKIIMFISGAAAAWAAVIKGSNIMILPRCILTSVLMYIIMLAAGLIFIREPGHDRSIVTGLFGIAGAAAAAIIKSVPKKRRRP